MKERPTCPNCHLPLESCQCRESEKKESNLEEGSEIFENENLLIHVTRYENLERILKEGIISEEFANRTGRVTGRGVTVSSFQGKENISLFSFQKLISDYEETKKAFLPNLKEAASLYLKNKVKNKRKAIKKFISFKGPFGFAPYNPILVIDEKLVKTEPAKGLYPGEVFAKFRIAPREIKAIIINEKECKKQKIEDKKMTVFDYILSIVQKSNLPLYNINGDLIWRSRRNTHINQKI